MEWVIKVLIPWLTLWLAEKVVDNLLDRWRNRRPFDDARERAVRRRFHFWAAAGLAAWCLIVSALAFVDAGPRAPIAWALLAGAAIAANIARIRRRRLR